MTAINALVKQLSRLPGIGPRSSLRIVHYLLRSKESNGERLGRMIAELRERVAPCTVCGAFTEEDPCAICTDVGRDRSLLCVVEQPQDVTVMEETREYRGLYHVLNGVISPIDGIGPEDLAIDSLLRRVSEGNMKEVILATNPTVEGDTTAFYLVKLLERQGVPTTRPALGLPVGADLEYADRLTIGRALRGRTKISS